MDAFSSDSSQFLRVTVGAVVMSADREKLGTVREVRSQAFRVSPGLFRRGSWLPAYTVARAIPHEVVMLTIGKEQLPTHLLQQEPARAA
jgi:hypothetical protein